MPHFRLRRHEAKQEALARFLTVAALVLVASAGRAEKDSPYPKGLSVQEFEGMRFSLHLPERPAPGRKLSLLVGLHGMGSSGADFVTWFEPMTFDGFVACCPKSTGNSWNKPDVLKVKRLVRHLMEELPIDPACLHATGFSNGGAHLSFLVLDPKLPFATVCWMGSGFAGGKVPRTAKQEMDVLALAGEKDRAYGAAKQTPKLLKDKVRSTEFRSQPDLGHEIPEELMPYYGYWLKVMEGRCEPGEDHSFDWALDLETGREEMAERKVGGFVYAYSDRKAELEAHRHVQNVVFFDPLVRHYGSQLVAMMGEYEIDEEELAALRLTKTPGIAVLAPGGKVTARLSGKIDAVKLAKALRAVAKDKKPPR